MPASLKSQPLKVCSTCHYWVYRYKGLCTRINQGVGKFWLCENWAAADGRLVSATPGTEASNPAAP